MKYIVFNSTYKCPACGHIYERHSSAVPESNEVQIDCPFLTCKKCGTTFIDSRKKEYLTLNENERRAYLSIFLRYKLFGSHKFIPDIVRSLKRCSDKKYLETLIRQKFELYPLSEKDVADNPQFAFINDLLDSLDIKSIKESIAEQELEKKNDNLQRIKSLRAFAGDNVGEVEMDEYSSLSQKCHGQNDVIAIFFDLQTKEKKHVIITVGDRETIEQHLGNTDGDARKHYFDGTAFWVLSSTDKNKVLVFRVGDNPDRPFQNILKTDIGIVERIVDRSKL